MRQIILLIISFSILNDAFALKEKSHQRKVTDPSMMDTYLKAVNDARHDGGDFIGGKLKEMQMLGYVKPYVPVVLPPVVKKVWVVDQAPEDDPHLLISGHWVYIMISDGQWYNQQGGQ
jgi:hypothetical protein